MRPGCMPCKISATYQYPLLYGQGNLPVRSDVLAWLWLKIMALAWLFMALAHEIPSQSHGTWLWPGLGLPVARAMARVM